MYTLSYCCPFAVKWSISLFAPLQWKNNSYVKLCGVPPRLPVRVRLVRQSRLSNLSFVNLSAFTPNYCITINFAYQIYWSNKKRNLLHLFHTTSIFLRSANMRFENFQACVKVTRWFPLSFFSATYRTKSQVSGVFPSLCFSPWSPFS